MSVNINYMNLNWNKEQWFAFLMSLRDILRNGKSKLEGNDAFLEITNILLLVFLEKNIEKFDLEDDVKFSNIYTKYCKKEHFKFDVELIEKRKNPLNEQEVKNMKTYAERLFDLLFNNMRNKKQIKNPNGSLSVLNITKEESNEDNNYLQCVFGRLLMKNQLKKIFINIDVTEESKINIKDVTKFADCHAKDIQQLISKIFEVFYVDSKEDTKQYNQSSIEHLSFDALGDAFEKLISQELRETYCNYFTRRDVIFYMISEIGLDETHLFYEGACGTGGFPLGAIKFIKNKLYDDLSNEVISKDEYNDKICHFIKKCIFMNEITQQAYKMLVMNMLIHDSDIIFNINKCDSLCVKDNENSHNTFDRSAMNPPFNMSCPDTDGNVWINDSNELIEKDKHNKDDCKENYWGPMCSKGKLSCFNSSGLFIMHQFRSLKSNGIGAIIVDQGVINGGESKTTDTWQKRLRTFLVKNSNVFKITLFPSGTFIDKTGGPMAFGTCVIFYKKGLQTQNVEFCEGYFKKEGKNYIKDENGNSKMFYTKIGEASFNDIKDNCFSLNPKTLNINKIGVTKIESVSNSEIFKIPIEWKKVEDVCIFPKLKKRTQKDHKQNGKYPLYSSSIIDTYFMDIYDIENEGIILNKTNGQGKYKVSYNKRYSITDAAMTFIAKDIYLNMKYIYYILNTGLVYDCYIGNGRKNLGMERLKQLKLPIPSLQDQQKLVDFLDWITEEDKEKPLFISTDIKLKSNFDLNIVLKNESGSNLLKFLFNEEYQFFINLCEKSIQKYNDIQAVKNATKDMLFYTTLKKCDNEYMLNKIMKKEFDFITKDIKFENKKIGDICEIIRGKSKLIKNISEKYNIIGGGKNFIGKNKSYLVNENLPIISISGANAGMVQIFNEKLMMSSDAFSVFSKNELYLSNKYLFHLLKINENTYKYMQHGNGQPHFYPKDLTVLNIPIPSLSDQQKIVTYLDEKMDFHKTYWTSMSQMFSNDSFIESDEIHQSSESDDLEETDITVV